MVELKLGPQKKEITLTRYSYLLEDSAILKQIESLVDHGMEGKELGDEVRTIINDMRNTK